jgi:four helix bundle protein
MSNIKSFEDLMAWQKARQLTKEIYNVCRNGEFQNDIGLRNQICRAAVSIMSNIAEGFERNSNRDFANFLSYAKGSAGEVRCQLFVALDQNYIS